MTIPDFQTVMLPLLESMADGADHRLRDLIPVLADQFALSEEERRELLPSGRQARLDNRVIWAATYLKEAALVEPKGRGIQAITARGLQLLSERPERLSIKALQRFPEFVEFKKRTKVKVAPADEDAAGSGTLEESLEAIWKELRERLAQELLDKVRVASPGFFERLVVDLLVAMGYGGSHADAAQVVGGSGDGGIDGVIKQDPLGLDVVYVQAKRWTANVGRPEVQAFAGGLDGRQATKGVLITTSTFSGDARSFVDKISKKIVLIDGEQLAHHMIDYGVGAATSRSYGVQRVDLDYFEET